MEISIVIINGKKAEVTYNGKVYKFNDLTDDYWNSIGEKEGEDMRDINIWEDEDGWSANTYELKKNESGDWEIDDSTCEVIDVEVRNAKKQKEPTLSERIEATLNKYHSLDLERMLVADALDNLSHIAEDLSVLLEESKKFVK